MIEYLTQNKIIAYCLTALGYIPACFIGLSLESYAILALLILIDICTGITRDWLNKGGASIKSSILRDGLVKKGHVFIIPWLITIAGHGMGIDLLILAKLFLGGFIASELYSTIGNIYSIYTKEDKPEFDGVKFIMNKTSETIKKLITK